MAQNLITFHTPCYLSMPLEQKVIKEIKIKHSQNMQKHNQINQNHLYYFTQSQNPQRIYKVKNEKLPKCLNRYSSSARLLLG